jgi:hypothetical protein
LPMMGSRMSARMPLSYLSALRARRVRLVREEGRDVSS